MSRICEVCGKNRRLVIMSVTQITKQKQFGTPIFKNYVASTKNGFCEKTKSLYPLHPFRLYTEGRLNQKRNFEVF